ncbi:hypothetical protein ACH4PU_30690 [Streptomyces sp. NPDC021100]|uniref:hypothetical protein n=1 Tax=Streptomyces sp. NPDC021100 TaxID=3365114 RepID=UPI00378AC2A1
MPGEQDRSRLFEPGWDDNPTWEGSTELFTDLGEAQAFAAGAYIEALYGNDEADGELAWVKEGEEDWRLTEAGQPTGVSIGTRAVRGTVAAVALRAQLSLASEFRVPLPDAGAGGYGEVVVKRQQDGPGDRWAVTDGADTGLRAWVDGEGWRHVTDIGRAVAFRHTREEALLLAHQVAEIEATCYGAEIDALGVESQDGESQ